MSNENIKRSLKTAVVGLGQCGGNLALSFALQGYEAAAFNTSSTDLRGLDLPDARKYHMSIRGSDGVGRDRSFGGEIIRANSAKILEICYRLFQDSNHLVLSGGLAGGTGSNIGKIAEILTELRKPITIIGTLPGPEDSSIDKLNAVLALGEISKIPAVSIALCDNGKIQRRFPKATLENHFRLANNSLVGSFDFINKIALDPYYSPLVAFDGEDFRKVLSVQGAALWGVVDCFDSGDKCEPAPTIDRALIHESLWPEGYDLGTAQRAGLIFAAPEKYLAHMDAEFWERWTSYIDNITKGCGVYCGIFKAPEGVKPRMVLLFNGMELPASVNVLIENTRIETQMLSRKMEQDLSHPEMDAVETFHFFEDPAVKEPLIEKEILKLESVDEKLPPEGAEIKPLAEPEQTIPLDIPPELSSEQINKTIRKTKWKAPLITAVSLIVVCAAILAGLKYTIFTERAPEYLPAASVPEKILKPAGLISIFPEKDIFYLIVDKSKAALDLVNSSGDWLKTFPVINGVKNAAIIPEGIYFPGVKQSGDNLDGGFFPITYRLNYPGVLDTVQASFDEGIFLGGYRKGTPAANILPASIALEAGDIVELNAFIKENRTPILIFRQAIGVEPETAAAISADVKSLVEKWRVAWVNKNWDDYRACFADDYIPQKGNLAFWEKTRKLAFNSPAQFAVKIDNLQVLSCDRYILAEFIQDYSSGAYSDYGVKRLYIKNTGNSLKIWGEDFVKQDVD